MLGAEQLSDQELLAILLATGSKEYSALDLAERLLQSHKGLPGLRELSLDELMEQKGLGPPKLPPLLLPLNWASGFATAAVITDR